MGRAARATFDRAYATAAMLDGYKGLIHADAAWGHRGGEPVAPSEIDPSAAREGAVVVRPMNAGDVPTVVAVHLSAFRGFFLSFLGPRFLRLFYAETIAIGEIALVADAGRSVLGFVMGSVSPGRFFATLLRRRALSFAWAALPALLRRPSAALRVARALRKPLDARKPEGTATLISLGVSPEAQGLGAGRTLVSAFLAEAGRRGARKVDLTTDKLANDRTNSFYRSLGFRVAREIVTPEGRILHEYELDLPPRQGRD